jgi:hypothetical protein
VGGARCLLRLSPDDLQSRFLGSVGDDFIVAHSDAPFAPGVIVLGCFIRGVLCAVGELHQQVTVRIAEIAIRVEPAFQLRPWNRVLRRLVVMGRNRGTKTLQCEAEIIQAWPSCWSLLDEAFASTRNAAS